MADSAIKLKHEDAFFNKIDPAGPDPYEIADDQAQTPTLPCASLQVAARREGETHGDRGKEDHNHHHRDQKITIITIGIDPDGGEVRAWWCQAATELPSRKGLPHMVDKLREAIEEDWSQYPFLVCSTEDEHLVVRFEMSTLDSEPGLVAFMNMFSRSHHVVNQLKLRKVKLPL
ncbi:MAG: hypothetical protein SGPRY_008653 [Prymnesium sp.]